MGEKESRRMPQRRGALLFFWTRLVCRRWSEIALARNARKTGGRPASASASARDFVR
jgi:hypothetical protein